MFTNLKVTKIVQVYGGPFYLINSRHYIQIQGPVDKEVVNKYYPLYYNVKNLHCLCRISDSHLVVSGKGKSVNIYKEGDNYQLIISEYYYDGTGKWKTKITTFNTTLEGAVLKIEELFS